MDNDITILVKGDELKKFISFSVSDSIDAVASAFTFTIARDEFDTEISQGDAIKIYVNGDLSLTGRVYKVSNSYDPVSHNITISGFSNTFDLTRATIYSNPNYATPIKFVDLAQKVLSDNGVRGISVSSKFAGMTEVLVGPQPDSNNPQEEVDEENRTAGDIGETLFAFLDRYAKKVGVILTDNNLGELVVYENAPVPSDIRLKNFKGFFDNRIIKSADYDVDYTGRYSKVIVKSQDEDDESIEASAIDGSVNAQGTLTIISENIVDINGCQIQADWEVNKRRTDSISYDCVVFGFSYKNTGLWQKNTEVDVEDDFAGVKSQMMIRSLTYNFSEDAGSTTSLSLTIPDAFGRTVSAVNRFNEIFGDTPGSAIKQPEFTGDLF